MSKMKNMRITLLCLLVTMISFSISAQNVTVKGTVKDKTGETVIGASVVQKGNTGNGTITDIDGNFTLSVPNNTTLIISYVGMKTQEVALKGKKQINVVLEDDAQALDEVVVIGYGTAKKKDLTGAVSTVKGSDLAKVPVTNAAEALTGKLAGVQITTTDGSPDAEMIIKVRGGGSITGDSSPLYIVDGFPVSSISDIAPTDIEDITVLKDAASTAIYGSQGANGVILITTKGAKGGKTTVSYNGYVQGKTIRKTLDVMDPYQFVMYNYERQALRGASAIRGFEERYGAYGDLDLYKYQQGHNWQEEMFDNSDLSQSHNISITGGSEKTKFTLSGTYANDNSLMENNGYRRYNMNFKLKHELYKNLNLDFGARLADTETQGVGTGGGSYKIRSYDALMKAPVNGLYDQFDFDPSTLPEEEYEEYINTTRSLKDQVNDYWRRKNERRYNFNAAINWDITKHFTYRAEGGYDYTFFQQKDWYGPRSSKAVQDGQGLPMGEWTKKDSWKLRAAHTLTWKQKFNKIHDVNIMIGQEYVASNSESNEMIGKFFQEDITPEKMFASMAANSGATGSRTISSQLGQEDRTISFFGRANYSLMDRYLLTFTIRADGSSNFMRGHRWGYFPSASVGWVVTNEKFMESTASWMDFLKIRGSWGQNGNQSISNFQYLTTFAFDNLNGYYFGLGNKTTQTTGGYADVLKNEDVTWETSEQIDLGIDARFLNSRLGLTFDWYQKKTKDWLVQAPIQAVWGLNAPYVNGGDVKNTGVELGLTWDDQIGKDFRYGAAFNLSTNKNEVTRIANSEGIIHGPASVLNQQEGEIFRAEVGKPIGYFWGMKTVGVFQNKAQIDEWQKTYTDKIHGNLKPGDVIYVDTDGNGIIDVNDKTEIGNPHPDVTIGFNLHAAYKGFDISVTGSGAFGQQIVRTWNKGEDTVSNLNKKILYGSWKGEGTSNYLPRLDNMGDVNWKTFSSIWVEDADYVKIQNVTLGYDFKNLWKSCPFGQLRLYVSAQNLFTFTGYSGMDPEIGSSGDTVGWAAGIDNGFYPSPRTYLVGVNVKF